MQKNFTNTKQTNSGTKKKWVFKNLKCKFLYVENIPKLLEAKESQEKYSAFYKNLPRLIKFSIFFRDSFKKYEKIFKNKGEKIIFFNLMYQKKKMVLFKRNFINYSSEKKYSLISCQSFIKRKKNKKYFNWLYRSFSFFTKHNFLYEQKKKSKKTGCLVKKKKMIFNRNITFLFSFFNKKLLLKKKNKSFLYNIFSYDFNLSDNSFFFHKISNLKLDNEKNLILGKVNTKKDFLRRNNSFYTVKKKAKIEFLSAIKPFVLDFIIDRKNISFPENISGKFFSHKLFKYFFSRSTSKSLHVNLDKCRTFLSKTNKKPLNFVEKNFVYYLQFVILSNKKIKKILSSQRKNFYRILIFRTNFKKFIVFDKDLDLLFVLFFEKKKSFRFDHAEGILNLERKRERKKPCVNKKAKEHLKILFLMDIKVLNNSKKNLNFPSFYLEFLLPEFKVLIDFISCTTNFSRIAFFKNSYRLLPLFHDLNSLYRKNWYKNISFFFRKKPGLGVWLVRKSKNFTKNFFEWYNSSIFQQRKIPRMNFNKKKKDFVLFDTKKWSKSKMSKKKFKNDHGQTNQKLNSKKKLQKKIKNRKKKNHFSDIKKKLSKIIKANFKVQIQKNLIKILRIEKNKYVLEKKKAVTNSLSRELNSKSFNQNQSFYINTDLFLKIGFVVKNIDFTPVTFFLNYKTVIIFSGEIFLKSIIEENYSKNSTFKFLSLDLLFLGTNSKSIFRSKKYFSLFSKTFHKKKVKKKKIRKLNNIINFFEINIEKFYNENSINTDCKCNRAYAGKKEEITFLIFLYLHKNESKLNIFHLKNKVKYVIDTKLKYEL